MSFVRYNTEDSVISSETVVRGIWSGDAVELTSFYSMTSSVDAGKFYTNVTSSGEIQFSVQYGNAAGSGSVWFNPSIPGKSPTRDIYGQYRNLIYGDENTNFSINGTTSTEIFVINVARSRYKESIQPGSIIMKIGSNYWVDDSSTTTSTSFIGPNRYYNIVAGTSAGVPTSNTPVGYLFPDIGCIILSPSGVSVSTTQGSNTNNDNPAALISALATGASFKMQSAETVSSLYFFTRAKNQEFNYTTNPSIIDDQGNLLYSTLINNPQTYITTVGMYNDNTELLAVAKLSKPLVKDFTKELLIRIKLDY